jgi:hypothetical protein
MMTNIVDQFVQWWGQDNEDVFDVSGSKWSYMAQRDGDDSNKWVVLSIFKTIHVSQKVLDMMDSGEFDDYGKDDQLNILNDKDLNVFKNNELIDGISYDGDDTILVTIDLVTDYDSEMKFELFVNHMQQCN